MSVLVNFMKNVIGIKEENVVTIDLTEFTFGLLK